MKRLFKTCLLIALAVIVYADIPAQAAAGRGSIRGVVMDTSGSPLTGAAVMVLADAETAKADKVIKRASTDGEGKFTAAGLSPGRMCSCTAMSVFLLSTQANPSGERYGSLPGCQLRN